jgi:hypothetical protein
VDHGDQATAVGERKRPHRPTFRHQPRERRAPSFLERVGGDREAVEGSRAVLGLGVSRDLEHLHLVVNDTSVVTCRVPLRELV